ncbi:ATP-binding protein [Streptomyces sp. NPDC048251]|uniref:ATP-binding protein n=1 Tax=Streptomyces sp. NPDC048251 TaxID=3154501 RepID=UPI003440FB4B
MTTTALRTPRAVQHRDGEVLNERIDIVPRNGDDPPRPQDATRVGIMRRIAAAKLRHCGLETLIDDVMVIVSELLTNAVLHSGTRQIALSLRVERGVLHIVVTDGMPGHARRREVGDDTESGRGLALVEVLARENGGSWGTSNAGAETWCSLVLPRKQPDQPPRASLRCPLPSMPRPDC